MIREASRRKEHGAIDNVAQAVQIRSGCPESSVNRSLYSFSALTSIIETRSRDVQHLTPDNFRELRSPLDHDVGAVIQHEEMYAAADTRFALASVSRQ